MKYLIIIISQFYFISSFSQSKDSILIKHSDWKTGMISQNFYFLNTAGDTVLKLDSSKYLSCDTDTFKHFAIVSFKNKTGWWAIDRKEHVLFEVFNASISEPGADELEEGLIRIIDKERKVGFANETGEIVIKPQFDWVSSFRNGKAIFGTQCKKEPMIMNGKLSNEFFDLKCKEYGYINKRGELKTNGYKTFEQLAKFIGW